MGDIRVKGYLPISWDYGVTQFSHLVITIVT